MWGKELTSILACSVEGSAKPAPLNALLLSLPMLLFVLTGCADETNVVPAESRSASQGGEHADYEMLGEDQRAPTDPPTMRISAQDEEGISPLFVAWPDSVGVVGESLPPAVVQWPSHGPENFVTIDTGSRPRRVVLIVNDDIDAQGIPIDDGRDMICEESPSHPPGACSWSVSANGIVVRFDDSDAFYVVFATWSWWPQEADHPTQGQELIDASASWAFRGEG